jgi:hypothetical protein
MTGPVMVMRMRTTVGDGRSTRTGYDMIVTRSCWFGDLAAIDRR